ncbi:hypothetical protein [uncultured Gimesia sp.]|uniref:hypothetical protein n=1 Tax=uncultured Gimesia sp. TaxID=1678688 RepID=UPI002609FDAB|nr:hypothetical protein [uncultured Gimesia sp.]
MNSVLKNFDSQLHWTARCLIRVCLLLSLWNLPFPWLHNHDLHQETEEHSFWLFSHVDEFHNEGGEELKEQGWHLHFVYFGGEQNSNPFEDRFPVQHQFIVGESSQPMPASEFAQTSFQRQVFASVSLKDVFASPFSLSVLSIKDRVVQEQFLQSFQKRSLRDLISVSLC